MRRLHLALAAAVLTSAVACGGDDPKPAASSAPPAASVTPSPTPSPVAKSEYVGAVNKICDRVVTEAEGITEPKSAQEYQAAMAKILGIIERAQADVRELTPPAEDAADLEKYFLTPNDEQAAAYKAALPKMEAAIASNDLKAAEAAFTKAVEEGESTEEETKWIMGYGLTSCAAG